MRESRSKNVDIRWGIRRDIPEILEVENSSFEFRWTEGDFLRCLRQRNRIMMVAEDWTGGDSKICGFMLYELHPRKLRLLNFAVLPSCRRQGIGSTLVAKLLYKVASHRREKVELVVREGNLTAQRFFRNRGFAATKVLHDYYEDSGEAAYEMSCAAPPSDEFGPIQPVNRLSQYEETP